MQTGDLNGQGCANGDFNSHGQFILPCEPHSFPIRLVSSSSRTISAVHYLPFLSVFIRYMSLLVGPHVCLGLFDTHRFGANTHSFMLYDG
jgi:hypothetical protein